MSKRARTEVDIQEKDGRCYSRRTDYYENGNILETGHYTKSPQKWEWDIPVGVVSKYYEDGSLLSEENYDSYGCLDGEANYFDQKGRLTLKVLYKSGVKIREEVLAKDDDKS